MLTEDLQLRLKYTRCVCIEYDEVLARLSRTVVFSYKKGVTVKVAKGSQRLMDITRQR